MSNVMWIGLSAQLATDNSALPPFSDNTPSGAFISEAEQSLPQLTFLRTNLVSFAPVDTVGKLRYPTHQECKDAFPTLRSHIQTANPSLVFLLGKQVSTFVLNMYEIPYSHIDFKILQSYQLKNTTFVPMYHPSYIMIYKRKDKTNYINRIVQKIIEHV